MSTIQEEQLSAIQSKLTDLIVTLSQLVRQAEVIGVEIDELYQTLPCQVSVVEGGERLGAAAEGEGDAHKSCYFPQRDIP